MRALLIFLAALFAVGPATAQPSPQPSPLQDWNRVVTVTPSGSYVLGDPHATRLIEYVSYTCPHCAHFVAEASGPLRSGWIRRGLIGLEVRNAIRDPYDLTAAVLARCGGKGRFFADHEAIFANQTAWIAKVQAYEEKRGEQPPAKDSAAQLAALAAGTGLSNFMVKRGVSLAQQHVCFADKKALAALAEMAKDAWEVKKIGGTPAFSVSGNMVDNAHDWTALRAALPTLPN
jgi:protein-disulfide isomerase